MNKMLQNIILLLLSINIVACDATMQNGSRLGNNIKDGFDKTRYKISRYIHAETPVAAEPLNVTPPPPVFCYNVRSDILCYDRPKPEMHLNLVGVHGENNYQYNDYLPSDVEHDSIVNYSDNNDYQNSALPYIPSNVPADMSYKYDVNMANAGREIQMRNLPNY
jgi:hypothetical protein